MSVVAAKVHYIGYTHALHYDIMLIPSNEKEKKGK